jgi:hypothetical protein
MLLIQIEIGLGGRLLTGSAIAAFGHNGLMEAGSEVFRKLVKLVIAVDFNGFLCGIHDHVAVVAPMEVFFQFDLQILADPAVEVIGQLF